MQGRLAARSLAGTALRSSVLSASSRHCSLLTVTLVVGLSGKAAGQVGAQVETASGIPFDRVLSPVMQRDTSSSASASWIDIDLDGDEDLYVLNGYGSLEPEPVAQRNVLYVNDGEGGFSVDDRHPLVHDLATSGSATWGDYDNDGDLDVFVANQGGMDNFLFRNDGDGAFERVLVGPIVRDGGRSFSSVWVDIDSDGWLDLHVLNGRDGEGGEKDFVYRKLEGAGFERMHDVAFADEVLPSGGGAWADYDEDGDPDLFLPIHASGEPSRLYRNEGEWKFTEVAADAGLEHAPLPAHPASSVAHWVDYDNDEDLDLFVGTTPPSMIDLMYQNDGTGHFRRVVAGRVGLDATYVSDALWADYDNDADLDLLIAAWGAASELYLNDGAGHLQASASGDLGLTLGFASSVSTSDIDQDGDLDVYLTQWPINEAGGTLNQLYRNDVEDGGWIRIRLQGVESNRSAIGARVVVEAVVGGRTVRQTRIVTARSSWRSSNSLVQHFGVGDAESVVTVEVTWPSGRFDRFGGPWEVNRTLDLMEGARAPEGQ